VAVLVPILVRIDRPDLTLLRGADYLGIVLLALALGCLEYVLEEGSRWDWFDDTTIRTCAWISAIAGIGFILRSLTYARPVVDLRALAIRNFSLGCWFSFVTGIGIFASVYLTPLFLARVRGLDASQIGLALLSAGIFQILSVPIYSALANRIDLRWLMMFGLACFGIGLFSFTPMTHEWGWRELILPQAFRGFAQQFSVAPVVTLTLGMLPPERLKSASGLFNLMRNLGGAIGIALCTTLLNDRTNLHFLRIAEHLTATNNAMQTTLAEMTVRFSEALSDPLRAQAAALKRLWLLTYREAQVQAFADVFLAISLCFVVTVLMVFLMRKVEPPKTPSPAGH
jgi:DHA2 family multidrug resistance protein